MKKIVYLIIIFMGPILSKAQTSGEDQKVIVGKWKMIKMEIKDGLYFDVSDKDSSFDRFSKVILQSQPNIPNNEDSAWIKDAFESAYGEFKELFVEFQNHNKYITNQSGGEGVSTLVSGTFSIDTKTHTLTRLLEGQKSNEVYYELSDNLLTLRPKEIENSTSMIVFKRSE